MIPVLLGEQHHRVKAEKRLTRWEKWRMGWRRICSSVRPGRTEGLGHPAWGTAGLGKTSDHPHLWEVLSGACVHAKSLQSCPTLCNTLDRSPPGSSVHGILQATILKWVPMPSYRGSSQPRDQTPVSYVSCPWQSGSLPLVPPGKPSFGGSHIYSIGLQGEELRLTEYTRGQTLDTSHQKLSNNQGSLKWSRAARDPAVCHRRAHAEPGQGGGRGESLGFGGQDPDWNQACALAV